MGIKFLINKYQSYTNIYWNSYEHLKLLGGLVNYT